MRRVRVNHHQHENHERWMVSYADFITLLFAFFVVMYAISSVNEGKYRVLSTVLTEAFRNPPKSLEPIQVGDLLRNPASDAFTRLDRPNAIVPDLRPVPIPPIQQTTPRILDRFQRPPPPPLPPETTPTPTPTPTPPAASGDPLTRVAERIQQALPALIRSDLVTVRRTEQWVEIEIKNSILFASGSAVINPQAQEPLRQIAAILADVPHRVQVEGFTDDQPISTPVFPSNWELSAARAASVVHLLTRNGVAPQRLAAVGYGEFRPVADNATAEGRDRNRRVVLVIRSEEDIRRTTGPPPAL